jgi:lipopolysaccharide/colanic/teichoic acid biosynthesis glycosyltransferase
VSVILSSRRTSHVAGHLVAMVLIKLDSQYVFFKQERVGMTEELFCIRSMRRMQSADGARLGYKMILGCTLWPIPAPVASG